MPIPMESLDESAMQAIGHIRTPFREKFGAPRQAGLAPAAEGVLTLEPPFNRPEALHGLEAFSHVWLIWRFHLATGDTQDRRPTVRPPRLGGNRRLGVFATRSPFRPNGLGLSAVRLLAVEPEACRLTLGGVDLADGAPVYDIKPYVPYADGIADAVGGFADARPEARLAVTFSAAAQAFLRDRIALRRLIEQTLALEPRPAFHGNPERVYGMRLDDVEVRWRVEDGAARVIRVEPA